MLGALLGFLSTWIQKALTGQPLRQDLFYSGIPLIGEKDGKREENKRETRGSGLREGGSTLHKQIHVGGYRERGILSNLFFK